MNLSVASRRELLTALAKEILHSYGHGRTLVAVDGVDGSGTRELADELAQIFRYLGHAVFRASIDDFYRARADRDRDGHGRGTGASYYHDTFNYSLLRRVLTDPYRMGGSTGFVTAGFDRVRDVPMESKWESGPQDAVLIVDGVFLNRPELRGLWHYSILLTVSDRVAFARLAEGESVDADPAVPRNARYREAQALYSAEAHPMDAADCIIDNTDSEHPKRV